MRKPATKIRVLVVDDHPVVRRGLSACLAGRPPFEVVGEAADGEEAVRLTRALQPDLVLMDINMPRMDGLQVTEVLRQDEPKTRVVILSIHNRPEYVQRVIKAGARAYLLKDAPADELVRVLELVYRGEVFFSPAVAQSTLNQYATSGGKPEGLNRISSREREVLTLVASGKSNKEIASALGVGVRTVETHRERIMRKLDLHSVAALTKFAVAHGLVSLE